MPLPPDNLLTPEDEELARKQASLADLEAQLADRELELATLSADLFHFEARYLQTIGRRYALLDELRAEIAEALAQQNPAEPTTQDQARQARAKAQESARSVGAENAKALSPDDAAYEKPNRSESLTKLYRKVAMALHPDLTLNPGKKNAITSWRKLPRLMPAATRIGSGQSFAIGTHRPKTCKAMAPAPSWSASSAKSPR